MERETLRLILIAVGVMIIVGILLFGNPERRKRRAVSRRSGGRKAPAARTDSADSDIDDDTLQQELRGLGDLIAGERGEAGDSEQQAGADQEPARRKKPAGPPPDKIVTLFVRSRGNRTISGVQLLDAAIKAGLVFGDMDIFHRQLEGGERSVFSMANITKPGHFDRTAWNTFETAGVTLFLSLPGPMDGLDAWDAMLATGQRLGELLNADVLDDQQLELTRQRIAQIRDDLREYDRRRALTESQDQP